MIRRYIVLFLIAISCGFTASVTGYGQTQTTTRIRLADTVESPVNSPVNAPTLTRNPLAITPGVSNSMRDDKADSDSKAPAKCKYCDQIATCKVCRAVSEKKKINDTVFSCECEDFCIQGRSQVQCNETVDESGCVQSEREWIPTAARMAQRKKLVKSTETREVTQWKLVVEHVCPNCAQCPAEPAKTEKSEDSEKSEKSENSKPKAEKTSSSGTAANRLPLWFRR